MAGAGAVGHVDLEEAISIAGRIRTLPAGGTIEVRPVMHMTGK